MAATESSASLAHETREERALRLYRKHRHEIVRVGEDTWLVPSSSRSDVRHEVVYPTPDPESERCSCEDFRFNGGACKHLYIVAIHVAKRTRRAKVLAPLQ